MTEFQQKALRALLIRENLPLPIYEHRFHVRRRWRFDAAWPEHMLALEVEGGVWTAGRHTRGSGFLADMEKYSEAAALGWRILRCTPDTLTNQATLDLIRRALPGPERRSKRAP